MTTPNPLFPNAAPRVPPPDNDPSLPLRSQRQEQAARLRADGMTQVDAWRATTSGGRCTQQAAINSASKLFADPVVRARVAWLTADRERQARDKARVELGLQLPDSHERQEQPATAAAPTQRAPTRPVDDEEPLTKAEAVAILTREARHGEAQERFKAFSELRQITPETFGMDAQSLARPDPVAIVTYVASFAGMQPHEIIAQLGGWRFIADKLCAAFRCTLAELVDGLRHGTTTPSVRAMSATDAGEMTQPSA